MGLRVGLDSEGHGIVGYKIGNVRVGQIEKVKQSVAGQQGWVVRQR